MSLHLSDRTVGHMRESAARLRRAIEMRHAAVSDLALTADLDTEIRLAAIDLLCTVEVEVIDEARFLAEDAAAGGAA